jgi:tetratricopeptide (TPR) repeat protein
MDFNTGIKLYEEGKFEEAATLFDQLISRETGKAVLHLYRGRILTRLGKYDLALADFDLLVTLEPYNTDFISDRAVVLHLMGRHEEALEELDRAANLDPRNPYRFSSRAFLKDRMGDFKGAIEDYEKAIALDPEDAVSLNNNGLVEEKLGYKERAKKSFEQADNLVGYPPKENSEIPPSKVDEQSSEVLKSSFTTASGAKKITFGHFWATLKLVFGDKIVREEFNRFIKDKILKKTKAF